MPKKFKPIRVKISTNSPLENFKKIEGETCNPVSEATKEIEIIDAFKKKQ